MPQRSIEISCSPSSFITATEVNPNSCIPCVPSSLVTAREALSINTGGLLSPAPPWSPVLPAPPCPPSLPGWILLGVRSGRGSNVTITFTAFPSTSPGSHLHTLDNHCHLPSITSSPQPYICLHHTLHYVWSMTGALFGWDSFSRGSLEKFVFHRQTLWF